MITEEAYRVAQTEYAELQRRVTALTEQLASALQQISDLEAKKIPPPRFVEAIRPLVVARKISGGTRSAQGSQTAMRLSSLAATWQAQGYAPLDEFRRLLQNPLPQV